ncbi:MAG TPA: aminotransferase class I/II-fold pyridoxal phosphate-dependent enzyme, partial [Vulgatibacter sp.]
MRRIHLSSPHMGERERALLIEAFDSNWIAPLGPNVDAFEAELSERLAGQHVAALSSGTAALHLSLCVLGVGPGDEVIVPTLTFAASANPVTYLGARPAFVDASASTWTMDPALLAEELEKRSRRGKLPKAVMAVDLYGQCADYDPIRESCAKWGVPLVEDAAEGLGATYKGRPAGTLGDLGAIS